MGSNQFGQIFRITTWGETHGKGVGVVIDGCPANLPIDECMIQKELDRRRPGASPFTSPRNEPDRVEILSGLFDGKTTGAPISLFVPNKDVDSSKYEPIKELIRPGHADYTYAQKYGNRDHRGSGRASARETVARVAAGAIAKALLQHFNIDLVAHIKEIGGIALEKTPTDLEKLKKLREASAIGCPCPKTEKEMVNLLMQTKAEGDSLGGIVELITSPLPLGLGEPLFEKCEANLAKAMMSLPATKGFEIGSGFAGARMKGSKHNDTFVKNDKGIQTTTNHAGGLLGGITNGMPLTARVAFKPTSSIAQTQKTLTQKGELSSVTLPEGSRHDPCVALRALPIVEAMAALVIADLLLMNQTANLSSMGNYL